MDTKFNSKVCFTQDGAQIGKKGHPHVCAYVPGSNSDVRGGTVLSSKFSSRPESYTVISKWEWNTSDVDIVCQSNLNSSLVIMPKQTDEGLDPG